MNPSTGGHLHITFCHPGLCHMGYFQVLSSSLSSSFSSLLFNPYWQSLMASSSHPAYHDHNQHNIRWSWKATMPTRPDEANEEFAAWKLWVGNNCTWLYIGSQVILVPVPVAHIFEWVRLPGRCLSSPSTSASLPMWSSALRRALRSITTPRGETNFKLILWRFTLSCSQLVWGSEERNPEYNNLFDEMMIGLNIWCGGDCDVKIVW